MNRIELNVKSILKKGFLGVLGLVTLLGSFQIVSPGNRGIVVRLGAVQEQVLEEGFHLKIPFITEIREVSIRVQKSDVKTEAASKDLQSVHSMFTINWRMNPQKVHMIYKNTGDAEALVVNILTPAVNEVLKIATAKKTAEEIIAKRAEVKAEIDAMLVERMKKYDLVVEDVSLVNLTFSEEFNKAIEAKQIAEQRTKQAQYEADKAKIDAESAVNKAKGEADSAIEEARGAASATITKAKAEAAAKTMIQKTLTPQILKLEYYKTWNGVLPQVVTNGGVITNLMPQNPTSKSKKEDLEE